MKDQIPVRISREAHHRLKVFCAEHCLDMQVVANLAVLRYMEKLEAEEHTVTVSEESKGKIVE